MTYKKKLIEVALPLAVINKESARQKTMGAAPHPQNLHRWWARRPLAATRAVLWASLVDDPSAHPDQFPTEEQQAEERKRLFDILERLVPWSANDNERVLDEARAEIIKSCDGELPRILDPFGGGGAIPIEAVRLGLPTFSGDLNPVPVLIQRAMLQIPQTFAGAEAVHPSKRSGRGFWQGTDGLAADVEAYGEWMLAEAHRRIGNLYPDLTLADGGSATPIAWIWARTVKSPDPAWPGRVPLAHSWEIMKKTGKPTIWVEPVVDHQSKSISYVLRHGGKVPPGNVSRQGGSCLATGASIPFTYIREEARAGRMGSCLIATIADSQSGRVFLAGDGSELDSVPPANDPVSGPIFDWPGRMNVVRYGLDDWSKLFTPRQLLALTTFSDLLVDVREAIQRDSRDRPDDGVRLRDGGSGTTAYADAIVTNLAFVIDKCADNWSTICTWHVNNGQTKQTFSKQAIPMTWDFAEVNPFSGRLGSWTSMLGGVVRAIGVLPMGGNAIVEQRDARARIKEVGSCVLSTDPPYYDNICYADLSDFFYVWLRRNLREVWPDECATLLTPKVEELIANQYRAGSRDAAQLHFELGMQGVFGMAADHADERYPATVFYAFKATESSDEGVSSTGWETFLGGLLDAGFAITATWPMRTEMTVGVKSGLNVLATSVVLACRRRHITAPMATRGEFVAALRSEMPPAIVLLQAENIAPVDMAQSAIGPGIGVFSRYARVVEADGASMSVRAALTLINEVLAEVLSGEESEFDADTRFAVTWFEQYGHNPGSFGDADSLARAKNTTVDGVVRAGVAVSREGRVRLVERSELSGGWDPRTDHRLTVWETTHHMIRALESSEFDASRILRLIGGGLGERARQLAYLLYGICDRKKWSEEAGAYNMLVTAWPEIERLAALDAISGDAERLF